MLPREHFTGCIFVGRMPLHESPCNPHLVFTSRQILYSPIIASTCTMAEQTATTMTHGVLPSQQGIEKDALVKERVLSSTSSGQFEYVPLSIKEDRALTWRLDIRIIPIFGLLYLICFLDRTNIANARLAGLEKALDFPSNGFNVALSIFYIPFVSPSLPSTCCTEGMLI